MFIGSIHAECMDIGSLNAQGQRENCIHLENNMPWWISVMSIENIADANCCLQLLEKKNFFKHFSFRELLFYFVINVTKNARAPRIVTPPFEFKFWIVLPWGGSH